MLIKFVEISNFRKLLSIRVDLSSTTTLFVGANNSGKTSAMLALRKFLSPKTQSFELHDFTLCHWASVNAIGERWLDSRKKSEVVKLDLQEWSSILPAIDIWLEVGVGELHHVRDLIPTLDWEGGDLGVRLRLQPKELTALYKGFLEAIDNSSAVKAAAVAKASSLNASGGPDSPDKPIAESQQSSGKATEMPSPAPVPEESIEASENATPEGVGILSEEGSKAKLTIWPTSLVDYLSRKLSQHFDVRAYALDPAKILDPDGSQARPQQLPEDALPIEGTPLQGLVRVNDIPAQRGFGEPRIGDADGSATKSPSGRLSDQLRTYYARHLDPTDAPDPSDLEALQAIEAAQDAFDARLTESFRPAFAEVEGMGYPGVTDPRPRVATRLKAIDGLNHSAAVSFEVDVVKTGETSNSLLRLPEDSSGLGYQNLISMIFRLMSFRDAWMRVGKASKSAANPHFEPLHLVLVEEPEAHLHAQVQQVFINKAYDVLRAHSDLGASERHRTQLVVSTHSSHVAHESSFACLRYFRRLPAGMIAPVPVSAVINLSKVFGTEHETERFVTRYLRAQHSDLFFADAAILVEGPAERMLLPNFIRAKHKFLNQCYLTILEIGGSHAHRLRALIEEIGLLTLVVTDLDSLDAASRASVQPAPSSGQVSNNATLKSWVPGRESVDDLYAAKDEEKVLPRDQLFEVRAAYQVPVRVKMPGATAEEVAYPYTFEDALAFQNIAFFSSLTGTGLIAKFRDAVAPGSSAVQAGAKMFKALENGKKADFALDIIDEKKFEDLEVPTYIGEGLVWLESKLKRKQAEVLAAEMTPLDVRDAASDADFVTQEEAAK